jgi:hypothetical protein
MLAVGPSIGNEGVGTPQDAEALNPTRSGLELYTSFSKISSRRRDYVGKEILGAAPKMFNALLFVEKTTAARKIVPAKSIR